MPSGMIHHQTPDSKKEEYKKYLEKQGVTDALTKVLVGLYEEPDRPSNALDYIKKHLSGINEVDALKKENEELKNKVVDLERTIGELRFKAEEESGHKNHYLL
mmetsp:Transcript_25324/g.31207  ORF Transcript_25324/g.31207 Transcript_25324/m.31207 type:complete len:103 (+) Transcript_25324:200-508(+)